MYLKGKTALITGASSGIGKEFALQLASRGMNLVITARNEGKLQDVAGSIREKHGANQNVKIIPGDLIDPATPQKLFEKTERNNIHIDLLVNNAGFGHIGNFENLPFDKSYRMNEINVVALTSMCHLFIPPMLEKGEGGVINLGSTASFQPLPYMAVYAATKAFVLNLSLALWEEYRERGVTVMTLCPGHTRTGFHKTAEFPDGKLEKETVLEPDAVVKGAIEAFLNKEPLYVPVEHRSFLQFTLSKFIPLKKRLKMTADMIKP